MNSYDRANLQKLINKENGDNYSRNVPLNGFVLTFGDAFISFYIKEINNTKTAIITYIYVTNKEELVSLLGYCVNMWSGYDIKMIYYREHRRKSNIVNLLKYLDFDVNPVQKTNWKYKWKSTNGYKESDCIEAFTKPSSK